MMCHSEEVVTERAPGAGHTAQQGREAGSGSFGRDRRIYMAREEILQSPRLPQDDWKAMELYRLLIHGSSDSSLAAWDDHKNRGSGA